MAYKIFLSPSDQKANAYAAGNTNEAAQCGRIAASARAALERCGFAVMLVQYESMASKCAKSDAFGADLHVPIHSNAFDGKVAGTRILTKDTSGSGYQAGKSILRHLGPLTPGNTDQVQAYPQLYEIRVPKAPTAYIETDFHDVPAVASWIIAHTQDIGEAICHGICDYFGVAYTAREEPEQGHSEKEEDDMIRYRTLGDLKAAGSAPDYLPTIEKLLQRELLRGKGGSGDEMILDLSEDAVRLLVILDRAGAFGD